MLNINHVRQQFPILTETVNGKPLVYFDNGATTQKPQRVIDAIVHYYTHQNSNIHRGVHALSRTATDAYELGRTAVQQFIGAKHAHEIIFTKGTTDSINLVANSFSRAFLKTGDEIIVSEMEHHSNFLPWQNLRDEKGIVLKVIPLTATQDLDIEAYKKLLSDKTRLVAVTQVSNTLGVINPVKEIIAEAKKYGAKVLLDGAQAVPHMKVDMQELDADFYAFSMHKVYGPTGMGVLYAKEELLQAMPPYQYGGGIIKSVTIGTSEWADLPNKFEAGTPNIEAGPATKAAIDFVNEIGIEAIAKHEHELLIYATKQLQAIQETEIYGNTANKAGVISFNIKKVHPFDTGTLLDQMGIAVRTGHHCTQPLMHCLGIPGTVRASFAVYNTIEEVDAFITGVKKAVKMLL
ncbi:MAG: cysteine desulfurase [Bacteroidetes bacterium]|jgi:cysteine desulfurase/selenocysteine lyase|nr:cysteine desulfurase [Bacteroidota bacterium]